MEIQSEADPVGDAVIIPTSIAAASTSSESEGSNFNEKTTQVHVATKMPRKSRKLYRRIIRIESDSDENSVNGGTENGHPRIQTLNPAVDNLSSPSPDSMTQATEESSTQFGDVTNFSLSSSSWSESYEDTCTNSDSETSSSDNENGSLESPLQHRMRARMKKQHDRLAPDPQVDHYAHLSSKSTPPMKRKRKTLPKSRKKGENGRRMNGYDSYDDAQSDDNISSFARVTRRRRNLIGESQEVSIHLIDLKKFEGTEKEVIKKIIGNHNNPPSGHRCQNVFQKQKVSTVPEIPEDDKTLIVGEEFHVKVYTQNVKRQVGLLKAFGISESTNLINTIIFYYRPGDLFALTTGQAWNCVQQWSDYDFPGKIAARLLSEKGQLETNSKALLGDVVSSRRTMKKHQQKNPFETVTICTSFSAKLRPRSSLEKFSAFSSFPETKVNISLASVRFKKRLNVVDFSCILDHCAVISRGEKTFKKGGVRAPISIPLENRNASPSSAVTGTSTDTAVSTPRTMERNISREENINDELVQEELDSNKHLHNLTTVSLPTAKLLNEKLMTLIKDSLEGNTFSQLDNFEICHKHYTDFFNADKITVAYKGKAFEFNYVPTVFEVLDKLRFENFLQNVKERQAKATVIQHNGERSRQRKSYNEAFSAELDSVRVSFTVAGSREHENGKTEKFASFLEGSLWNKDDERVYWRVMNTWCCVRDSYLLIVHEQWLKIVHECVMMENSDGYLDIPLPRRVAQFQNDIHDISTDEETGLIFSYIKRYTEQAKDFYSLLDDAGRNDERLGDMIYISDDHDVFIYFITRYLSYKSLRSRAEIISATTSIQNSLREVTRSPTSPKGFKDKIAQLYRRHGGIQATFKKLEKFHDAVRHAKIIYAFGDDDGKMKKESQLSIKMQVQDIELKLQSLGVSGTIAETIFEALKKAKYLDGSGSVTSKLLISDQLMNDFNENIVGSIEATKRIAWDIVNDMKSEYNGIQSKLELQEIRRDVDGKMMKFMMCPIPVIEEQSNHNQTDVEMT